MILINGEMYECEPAVEAYIKDLQADWCAQNAAIAELKAKNKQMVEELDLVRQRSQILLENVYELEEKNNKLKTENERLEEKYQKATGVIATDCVECKRYYEIELSGYRQNAIVFKPELMYTLKECEPKLGDWHNENPSYQNLQEIRYRAAKVEYDKIMKVLSGWGIKNEVSAVIKQLENEIDELKTENEALKLLIEWAEECDFGYDNFPEEYERYKDEIEDMGYIQGMIHIAKRVCQQKRGAE